MNCGPFFLPVTCDDIEDIAVAITKHGENYHAALIYRDSNSSLNLLELGLNGHPDNNSPPTGQLTWAIPRIDAILRRNAAALCELIAETSPVVYYAFDYPMPAEFSVVNGDLHLGEGAVGLTCATFVLAVLHSVQIELLRLSTWQPRDDDEKWQRRIHAYLAKKREVLGIPQFVIDANSARIPCLRYRPEEVVAGALDHNMPVDFVRAASQGPLVRQWLDEFLNLCQRRTVT
jgi:hypothetical protein